MWRSSVLPSNPIIDDDRITNEIALSKICHWAFDKGLLTLSDERTIIVSGHIKQRSETLRMNNLLDLNNEPIIRPNSNENDDLLYSTIPKG